MQNIENHELALRQQDLQFPIVSHNTIHPCANAPSTVLGEAGTTFGMSTYPIDIKWLLPTGS